MRTAVFFLLVANLEVRLTYIRTHLKIPFMIFPDFERDARQTCIETQKGVPNPCPCKNKVFDCSLLSYLIYIVLGLEYKY